MSRKTRCDYETFPLRHGFRQLFAPRRWWCQRADRHRGRCIALWPTREFPR